MGRKVKWYQQSPAEIVENGVCYLPMECDLVIEALRLSTVIVNKAERNCSIIDVAISGDERIHQRQNSREASRFKERSKAFAEFKNCSSGVCWGSPGNVWDIVTSYLDKWIGKLGISIRTVLLQTSSFGICKDT